MLAQPPEQHRLHGVHPRLLFGVIRFQFRQSRPCARHKLPQLFQLWIDVNDWSVFSFLLEGNFAQTFNQL